MQVAKYKRKLVKDRSSFAEMDTRTLEVLLSRGAKVNHCSKVRGVNHRCLTLLLSLIPHVFASIEYLDR